MFKSLGKQGRTGESRIQGSNKFAPQGIFRSGCGKVDWLRGKYRTTSEAITKNTITAIILLILRSFQRKGLCDSSLKAKSITFVVPYNGEDNNDYVDGEVVQHIEYVPFGEVFVEERNNISNNPLRRERNGKRQDALYEIMFCSNSLWTIFYYL